MITVLLLFISNIFMTLAWYGHLKFKDKPLWLVIVASWALAFFEYFFQVPANRIGSDRFTLATYFRPGNRYCAYERFPAPTREVNAYSLFRERMRISFEEPARRNAHQVFMTKRQALLRCTAMSRASDFMVLRERRLGERRFAE